MSVGAEYVPDALDVDVDEAPVRPQTSLPVRILGAVTHDPLLAFVAIVFLGLILLATIGPLIWRHDPNGIDLNATLASPSIHHPFGADEVGRDVFARFMAGARISLLVGAVVVLAGAVVGGLVGLIAGSTAGAVDVILMRIMDALLSFPPLVLAMMVTVGIGVGLQTATIGIVLTSVPYYARILRSEVIRIRGLEYVQAAHANGASRLRIMFRHILPNSLSTVLVQASGVFGYAILTLAALGFVGLGAQVPTPEWGAMITEGQSYFLTGGWWIGVFPGLGLLLAVTAANLLADRIRDILDPRGPYTQI